MFLLPLTAFSYRSASITPYGSQTALNYANWVQFQFTTDAPIDGRTLVAYFTKADTTLDTNTAEADKCRLTLDMTPEYSLCKSGKNPQFTYIFPVSNATASGMSDCLNRGANTLERVPATGLDRTLANFVGYVKLIVWDTITPALLSEPNSTPLLTQSYTQQNIKFYKFNIQFPITDSAAATINFDDRLKTAYYVTKTEFTKDSASQSQNSNSQSTTSNDQSDVGQLFVNFVGETQYPFLPRLVDWKFLNPPSNFPSSAISPSNPTFNVPLSWTPICTPSGSLDSSDSFTGFKEDSGAQSAMTCSAEHRLAFPISTGSVGSPADCSLFSGAGMDAEATFHICPRWDPSCSNYVIVDTPRFHITADATCAFNVTLSSIKARMIINHSPTDYSVDLKIGTDSNPNLSSQQSTTTSQLTEDQLMCIHIIADQALTKQGNNDPLSNMVEQASKAKPYIHIQDLSYTRSYDPNTYDGMLVQNYGLTSHATSPLNLSPRSFTLAGQSDSVSPSPVLNTKDCTVDHGVDNPNWWTCCFMPTIADDRASISERTNESMFLSRSSQSSLSTSSSSTGSSSYGKNSQSVSTASTSSLNNKNNYLISFKSTIVYSWTSATTRLARRQNSVPTSTSAITQVDLSHGYVGDVSRLSSGADKTMRPLVFILFATSVALFVL